MARCDYCNSMILFGGKKQGDLRFCDAKCEQRGVLALVASQLPADAVALHLGEVHRGNCPKCGGAGPVDVHTSYKVWSALVMTQWSSNPSVCCRSCGTKQRIGDTVYSALLGWWGFPWGLVMTPVQVGRNVVGFFRTPDPSGPSPALEKIVRLHLAANQGQDRSQPHRSF
jgi:hypothetical protein